MSTGSVLRLLVMPGLILAAFVTTASRAGAELLTSSLTTAGEQQFVVPPGVSSLRATLIGGNGASSYGGFPGGTGATVTATLSVTPGETLYAEVAGDGIDLPSGFGSPGGYGGGGAGGSRRSFGTFIGGGGGGGASDLRTCSVSSCTAADSLASRLVVAGGGGGGGDKGYSKVSTPSGGAGGSSEISGTAGAAGSTGSTTLTGGTGGRHGMASAGGQFGEPSEECTPSTSEGCATAGSPGDGGVGGEGLGGGGSVGDGGGGGGGGGGLFGGGGGGGGEGAIENLGAGQFLLYSAGGGGGGGGSSGVPAGVTNVSGYALLATAEEATPSVSLGWVAPTPSVLTQTPSALTSTTATLNGTIDPNDYQVNDCHFAISPASPAGATVPCTQQIGSGPTPVAVSADLTGLSPSTAYTVTLNASSAQGSGSGSPVTFTTAAAKALPNSRGGSSSATLTVSALKLSPTSFRRGKHAATISTVKHKFKRTPTATTISFALSQAATIALTFEQAQPGILTGKRCAKPTKTHRKGKKCTRYATVHGAVTRSAHAGTDKIHFEGALDGAGHLKTGHYRLSLTASDTTAKVTATQRPAFTLLP
jgi:hypothetical protein